MFGTFYNHHQLRRYLIAFGSFFDNIQIRREDANSVETQRFVVPLSYGPKEKWMVRLTQDPDLLQGVAMTVPRIVYELSGLAYMSERHLNTLNPMSFATPELKHLAKVYVGVPYDLNLTLSILVKNQNDGLQIVEQILPYFAPDLTFRLKTIPELGHVDQVPLVLTSVSESDNYEGDFEKRRAIIWTLGFTMKVNFYGPVRAQNRIDEVIVDLYNSPLADLLDPPQVIAGEDLSEFELENGTGHLMDESTPNAYLQSGRVSRVDIVATNPDQDPTQPVTVTTTLTDDDGDVKRTRTGTDELL